MPRTGPASVGTGRARLFVELASLADKPLRDLLDNDEETRLDAWRVSQSDTATFFLDSIDELNLSLGSFRQALKSLKNSIDGKLGQARIIITTRPIPIDENSCARCFPFQNHRRQNRKKSPSQTVRCAVPQASRCSSTAIRRPIGDESR